MSYAAGASLQAAIHQRLTSAPELAGVAIHDALPPGTAGTFVLIGPEQVRDASDRSGGGAEHRFLISVITDAEGFLWAKTIAAGIADRLAMPGLVMTRGRLVDLTFERAVARRRDLGAVRRIDLTFRARIEL